MCAKIKPALHVEGLTDFAKVYITVKCVAKLQIQFFGHFSKQHCLPKTHSQKAQDFYFSTCVGRVRNVKNTVVKVSAKRDCGTNHAMVCEGPGSQENRPY